MKYDEFYKLCEKVYEPITNFEKSCLPLCAAENEQSEFTKILLNNSELNRFNKLYNSKRLLLPIKLLCSWYSSIPPIMYLS